MLQHLSYGPCLGLLAALTMLALGYSGGLPWVDTTKVSRLSNRGTAHTLLHACNLPGKPGRSKRRLAHLDHSSTKFKSPWVASCIILSATARAQFGAPFSCSLRLAMHTSSSPYPCVLIFVFFSFHRSLLVSNRHSAAEQVRCPKREGWLLMTMCQSCRIRIIESASSRCSAPQTSCRKMRSVYGFRGMFRGCGDADTHDCSV